MSRRRIYLDRNECTRDSSYMLIHGSTLHYVKNVLRIPQGDSFAGFDSSGTEYLLEVSYSGKDCIRAEIRDEKRYSDIEPGFDVCLCQSYPKGSKMDFIVRDVSQIGVTKVVPVISRRVAGWPEPGKGAKKIERWSRIAAEACKVSGRLTVPEITAFTKFEEAAAMETDVSLIFWEGETLSLRQAMDKVETLREGLSIKIFVGPEGGYTDEEIKIARSHNVESVSMGKRIMKVETAAVISTALTVYEIENRLRQTSF